MIALYDQIQELLNCGDAPCHATSARKPGRSWRGPGPSRRNSTARSRLTSRNGGEPCGRRSTPDKLTPTQDRAFWIDRTWLIADVCERPIESQFSANCGHRPPGGKRTLPDLTCDQQNSGNTSATRYSDSEDRPKFVVRSSDGDSDSAAPRLRLRITNCMPGNLAAHNRHCHGV